MCGSEELLLYTYRLVAICVPPFDPSGRCARGVDGIALVRSWEATAKRGRWRGGTRQREGHEIARRIGEVGGVRADLGSWERSRGPAALFTEFLAESAARVAVGSGGPAAASGHRVVGQPDSTSAGGGDPCSDGERRSARR